MFSLLCSLSLISRFHPSRYIHIKISSGMSDSISSTCFCTVWTSPKSATRLRDLICVDIESPFLKFLTISYRKHVEIATHIAMKILRALFTLTKTHNKLKNHFFISKIEILRKPFIYVALPLFCTFPKFFPKSKIDRQILPQIFSNFPK